MHTNYSAVTICICMCAYIFVILGVFSDILNLIFRDKSCSHITSEGVIIVGNIDPESAEMKQREHILAKCLQFLRSLARYDEFTNSACMHDYIICVIINFCMPIILVHYPGPGWLHILF